MKYNNFLTPLMVGAWIPVPIIMATSGQVRQASWIWLSIVTTAWVLACVFGKENE
jgi:hypothetical protein